MKLLYVTLLQSLTKFVEHPEITDKIVVYSKPDCKQCDYIKNIMKKEISILKKLF